MLHASFLYSPPDAISDPHAYSAVFTLPHWYTWSGLLQ